MVAGYDEGRFVKNLNEGLACVEKVLGNNKSYKSPENVSHSYTDKFLLAELLTNSTIQAQLNCFRCVGFTEEHLQQIHTWATVDKQVVTAELRAFETCSFSTKKTRKIESATKEVTTLLSPRGVVAAVTSQFSNRITEYFWKFSVDYSLVVYRGTKKEEPLVIIQRTATGQLVTTSDNSPRLAKQQRDPISTDLTWLFCHLNSQLLPTFSINRDSPQCYTPRRNGEITAALAAAFSAFDWHYRISSYFDNDIFRLQKQDEFDMDAVSTSGIFIPVIPLFNKKKNESADDSPLPPTEDLNSLLKEQVRSIEEKLTKIEKLFPDAKALITMVEVKLIILLQHAAEIFQRFVDGVQMIEEMLRKQLIQAVGKVVKPSDFAEYMNFHYRKLFKSEFQPEKFCYNVTRVDHHPEGVVSIETMQGSTSGASEPIVAVTRKIQTPMPMKFTLDAATNVTLRGDCFVHSWINHQFSDSVASSISLEARSGPFCSFILLLGTIHAADQFHPTHGIIVHSKDVAVTIPLLFELIPSAKTFKEATHSISPEMKEFAAAYRSMQLESTLFGLCVIQIKPQMERLLHLPRDSLTKEIELTEDLQDMFIQYQIPSDLLSYDGNKNASIEQQINRVKHLVSEIKEMIATLKTDEIHDVKLAAQYAHPAVTIPTIIEPVCDSYVDDYKEKDYQKSGRKRRSTRRKSFTKLIKRALSRERLSYHEHYDAPMGDSHSEYVAEGGEQESQSTIDAKKEVVESEDVKGTAVDITKFPGELDMKFEKFDTEGALCSSIIKVSDSWKKTNRPSFLTTPKESVITGDNIRIEKNKAFDLLDALSRSGILDIEDTVFHVVMASTHSFDETLMDTLIKKSVNPIAKVETSALIISSTIHDTPVEDLIQEHALAKVQETSSQLFS